MIIKFNLVFLLFFTVVLHGKPNDSASESEIFTPLEVESVFEKFRLSCSFHALAKLGKADNIQLFIRAETMYAGNLTFDVLDAKGKVISSEPTKIKWIPLGRVCK